jgi:hypothetical protein
MGPTALLPLRRKACLGFFRPKNPTASARCEPANFGIKGQHATSRPPKPLDMILQLSVILGRGSLRCGFLRCIKSCCICRHVYRKDTTLRRRGLSLRCYRTDRQTDLQMKYPTNSSAATLPRHNFAGVSDYPE